MCTNRLEKYFSAINLLSLSEIQAVCDGFEFSKLDKGCFFVEQNKVSEKIGFILRGCVKALSANTNGTENITCFKFEGSFITSFESFAYKKVSKKGIQAIEDCEILTMTYDSFHNLLEKIPGLVIVAKKLMEQEYIEKENYLIAYNNKTAREKYTHLLSATPEIVQRVKVQDIASYLGVTQRTLTRIRNAITKSKIF
jgi:CRP-like cAMP-binding protein